MLSNLKKHPIFVNTQLCNRLRANMELGSVRYRLRQGEVSASLSGNNATKIQHNSSYDRIFKQGNIRWGT